MEHSVKGLVLLALIASTATAQRVRDSAGVRIVENGPRLTAPVAFQLGDKPSFEFGGLKDNPADELDTRNSYLKGARLSDDRMVLIDKTRVRFFDPSGKLLNTVGRQGDGPGEYTQATDVCVTRGDTILVGQTRKPVTKLSPTGDLVNTIVLPTNAYVEDQFCLDDGSFVVMQRVSGAYTDPSTTHRFARIGPAGDSTTIAEWQLPRLDMLVYVRNVKAARGGHLYLAQGQSFDIRAYDRSGKLTSIIRTSDPLVPITNDDKEKLPLMAVRGGSSPAEVKDARKRAIDASNTKYWPTFGGMLVDDAGRIWVEDWATGGGGDPIRPSYWTAFDSTGKLLGRLLIPAARSRESRQHVVGFGRDEVFIYHLDDDGAVHFTAYPVRAIRR
jgi:hypothetical protein